MSSTLKLTLKSLQSKSLITINIIFTDNGISVNRSENEKDDVNEKDVDVEEEHGDEIVNGGVTWIGDGHDGRLNGDDVALIFHTSSAAILILTVCALCLLIVLANHNPKVIVNVRVIVEGALRVPMKEILHPDAKHENDF